MKIFGDAIALPHKAPARTDKPLIFSKKDWLDQCAILFPNCTPAEREQFWLDCQKASK